jgi:acetyl-CoA carboxylase biotin carboxyl carrier protein
MTDDAMLDGGSMEAAELPADLTPDAGDPAAGDAAAGDPAARAAIATLDPGDASLLALIDRLGSLLDRSDLSELAVESGGTRLVLRKPVALAPIAVAGPAAGTTGDPATSGASGGSATPGSAAPGAPAAPAEAPGRPSVKAPLTGVWYSSPAPGSAPFVAAGREVAIGQVIGLIEAMKLFNEIKSDLAGRVVRVVPESGALVKAKQPLIEVEPL